MNEILPSTLARIQCIALLDAMEQHRCLDFEADGIHATESLFEPGGGRMFGVLICEDKKGNRQVLKAFSGRYDGTYRIPGWVGPTFDDEAYDRITCDTDKTIHRLSRQLKEKDDPTLAAERARLSQKNLATLQGLYRFHTIDGKILGMQDIFPSGNPPTGTGDCCAPKLLDYAFTHQLHPIDMAECYYGTGSRSHRTFYGPCDEKCKPLMGAMLGLSIVHYDESLIVVDKPSGLLSVPGRTESDSVEARVRRLFPSSIVQSAVHRLDMDTSGLLVLALTKEAHRNLSIQFMHRTVRKSYVALLEGIVTKERGTIVLPFRLDPDRRPYQVYDEEQGKIGITHWERIQVERQEDGSMATRIRFSPETGRTHQLRIHSAHEKGLGHPIIGDRLYGDGKQAGMMRLHAESLSFFHPVTGSPLTFHSTPPF